MPRPTYPDLKCRQEYIEIHPIGESDIGNEVCVDGTVLEAKDWDGIDFAIYKHYSNILIYVSVDQEITEYDPECSVIESRIEQV